MRALTWGNIIPGDYILPIGEEIRVAFNEAVAQRLHQISLPRGYNSHCQFTGQRDQPRQNRSLFPGDVYWLGPHRFGRTLIGWADQHCPAIRDGVYTDQFGAEDAVQ